MRAYARCYVMLCACCFSLLAFRFEPVFVAVVSTAAHLMAENNSGRDELPNSVCLQITTFNYAKITVVIRGPEFLIQKHVQLRDTCRDCIFLVNTTRNMSSS